MKTQMSVTETFKRPSAFLPILMSFGALAIVVIHIAVSGTAPQTDEGTAAHLWQLLMAAQFPIVAFFLIKWVPQAPRPAFLVLVAQLVSALTALAPVYFLNW